jgi:hypothetical protein
MSYHDAMHAATTASHGEVSVGKTLDVNDVSRLAHLAYRVVLQQPFDRSKILRQLSSGTAKEVARAVLGDRNVDRDAIDLASRLKDWASRNTGIPLPDDAK